MEGKSQNIRLNLFALPALVAGIVLCGCSSIVRRDVVEKYDNGRPKKVIDRIDAHRYYEREIGESGELKKQQLFVNGVQDSLETDYNAEGRKLAEMSYKNGKRNGVTHEFYSNGRIAFEGNCIDGQFEGLSTWYYNNGRVQMKGNRHQSRDTGLWNYFDTAGIPVKAVQKADSGRSVYFDGCGRVITSQQWDGIRIMDQAR